MSDPLFPNPNPGKPFREPVARLAKVITDRIPVVLGKEKITKDSPEYIGLEPLCTDEQAEIAILMKKRVPRTMADMIKLTGKDEAYLERQLAEMSYTGLIAYRAVQSFQI